MWKIHLEKKAVKQLEKLPHHVQDRIEATLYKKIASYQNPRQFGKLLKGRLSEYWRYRIGNYRVICKIEDHKMTVLVIHIDHRKDIYQKL